MNYVGCDYPQLFVAIKRQNLGKKESNKKQQIYIITLRVFIDFFLKFVCFIISGWVYLDNRISMFWKFIYQVKSVLLFDHFYTKYMNKLTLMHIADNKTMRFYRLLFFIVPFSCYLNKLSKFSQYR